LIFRRDSSYSEQTEFLEDLISKLKSYSYDVLEDLKTKAVIIADLYRDLRAAGVPFKLTAFRSHMRGYCACPKM
jgi:hypothetical protein